MSLSFILFVAALGLDVSDKRQSMATPAPVITQQSQTDSDPSGLVIDILYQPGHRCVIAPDTRIIERNLTQPYRQQTLYGTAQCTDVD